MRYAEVRANPVVGTLIGELYTAAPVGPIDCMTRRAYDAFIRQTAEQFEDVRRIVDAEFIDDDPYTNADGGPDVHAMRADVARGRLKIMKTSEDQAHPYMTPEQNNVFRAVHDFNGHYVTGVGFDRHGEEAAWMRHSRMYHGLARRAMTTETRGQSSAFIWINGGKEFPPQKAILLPEWVSEP